MAENNLTDFEAQELLRQYSSDLRKLEFQLQQTKLAIHHLKGKSAPSEKVSTLKKVNNEVDIIKAIFEKDDLLVTAFVGHNGDASIQISIDGYKGYEQLTSEEVKELIKVLKNRLNHKKGFGATD
jgi:hypothetical protein